MNIPKYLSVYYEIQNIALDIFTKRLYNRIRSVSGVDFVMKKTIIILLSSALLVVMTGTPCILKQLTGIPCPGCGMTRAYTSLMKLDFYKAFTMHPLFFVPPLVPFIFYIKGKKQIINLLVCMFIIIYISVYIYRMAVYFPHTPPMDFNENNILFNLLKQKGLVQ